MDADHPSMWRSWIGLIARLLLGGLFILMGLNKAFEPVEFLKAVREYHILTHPLALNLVAVGLPWLEIFTGLLLVLGIAVRGAALVLVAMLVPFTLLVLQRALALQSANPIPFCAIHFDCGCGTGEVWICRKLLENVWLIALAVLLTSWRTSRYALRYSLLR